MKLHAPPWKTAWYDQQLSDRFFKDLAHLEKSEVRELEDSAQWMAQLMVEFGQLAQNMLYLERDAAPHPPQVRLATEKALKLAAMAAHLAAALDNVPQAPQADVEGYLQAKPASLQHAVNSVMHRLDRVQHQAAPQGPAPGEGDAEAPAPAAQDAAPPAGTAEAKQGSGPTAGPGAMRETILSLSRRGVSTTEIEIITGQPRTAIEQVLGRR